MALYPTLLRFLRRSGPALASVAILVGFIYFFSNLAIVLLVSGILALVLSPLMRRLEKVRIAGRGFPRAVGAAICLLLFLSIVAGVMLFLLPTVVDEVETIASVDLQQVVHHYAEENATIQDIATRYQLNYHPDTLYNTLDNMRTQLLPRPNQMLSYVSEWIAELGNLLFMLFSVLFITFFLLMDRKLVPTVLLFLSPNSYNRPIIRIYDKVKLMLRRYFTGVLIQISCLGTVVFLGTWILGIPNAFFIAVVAALLNLVPYIGPVIAYGVAVMVTAVAALEMSPDALGWMLAKLTLVFGVVQVSDALFFQPFIYANSVKAHPLEIFLVILVASQLGGISAMIAAVPAYTVLRIILIEILPKNAAVARLTREMRESWQEDDNAHENETAKN